MIEIQYCHKLILLDLSTIIKYWDIKSVVEICWLAYLLSRGLCDHNAQPQWSKFAVLLHPNCNHFLTCLYYWDVESLMVQQDFNAVTMTDKNSVNQLYLKTGTITRSIMCTDGYSDKNDIMARFTRWNLIRKKGHAAFRKKWRKYEAQVWNHKYH